MLLHSPVTSPTGAHDWSEHRHEKSEERVSSLTLTPTLTLTLTLTLTVEEE